MLEIEEDGRTPVKNNTNNRIVKKMMSRGGKPEKKKDRETLVRGEITREISSRSLASNQL